MSLLSTLVAPLRRDSATADTAPKPTVTPRYSVNENADAYTLEVRLPGVAKDGLELTVHEDSLTITGRRAWTRPDAWTALHRESAVADFALTLSHENSFDPAKVQAELRDGILRVTLPKSEAVKPRKIAVN